MKQLMLSKEKASYLFDHVLDGFKSSHEGIERLKQSGLIDEQEYTELLQKNSDRLIDRIREFKVGSKLLSVSFAAMFLWLAITDQDIQMRRARRMRSRRRNETENVLWFK
jgi:hypothetical protein